MKPLSKNVLCRIFNWHAILWTSTMYIYLLNTTYFLFLNVIAVSERINLCEQCWQFSPPEKVSGCTVHHQGVFVFSNSSHVHGTNRLINGTFFNSIKSSVMVYKAWNSVTPEAIHSPSTIIQPSERTVWGGKGLLCELFMEQFTL